jgi:hypothetical protein
MSRRFLFPLASILAGAAVAQASPSWLQWGRDAQHSGMMPVAAQIPEAIRAISVVDPNAGAIVRENGNLVAHYAVPLVEGRSVFTEVKEGIFDTISHWETQSWSVRRLDWRKGRLVERWTFPSDWKPVPFGSWDYSAGYGIFLGPDWEPVFHAAISGSSVYVPGAGGSLFKVGKRHGRVARRINPFGPAIHENIFVAGPISVSRGNIYYNAIELDPEWPWSRDAVNSWLVRINRRGGVSKVSYDSLAPGAPGAADPCRVEFGPEGTGTGMPWPPEPDAVPPTIPCGPQRPAINLAPAVARDGTIYTVSRAHRSDRDSYLIAVRPDLTLRWAASLRGRLNDGCGVSLPPNGSPGGCRVGAAEGVDPATNESPAGRVHDDSSSSPTVAPDGSVLYGAFTRYNFFQGHLMKFSRFGSYLGSYGFGWDTTAGIYSRHGTYSIVLKENRYSVGSYCGVEEVCPSARTAADPFHPEEYFVTQLSPALVPEWQWRNENTESCRRNPDDSLSCESDHPNGFEFCVNHVAIDRRGVVYANSEDGNLYAIGQGGTLKQKLFLNLALGAAYTPVSLGPEGKIYAQQFGQMVVAGKRP